MLRVLRRRRRHHHDRAVAGRRRDALAGRLPQQRPDHAQPRRPVARVLELGQRPDERERARHPGVHVRERRQAEPGAAVVVLLPPALEPPVDDAVEAPPQPRAGRGARPPRADRERREAGRRPGVDVRDERRHGHAGELRRERGRGREDVGHRDVGRERLDRGDGLPRRRHGGLIGLERALAGREDLVLRRRGERDAGRLGGLLPAPPGLQRDGVPAGDQRLAQRQHGERVAGIAEGAEEDPHSALT